MYEQWCYDREEEYNLLRSQSILIGSFSNPAAAQDMLKIDNPDYSSSDEDFEQSLKMIREQKPPSKKRKRRRRIKQE